MRPALWLAAGFVLLNLIGLDRSPVVWIDEVTLNDPAKELARHGVLRSSVFAGQHGFEEHYLWQPPGQPLVTAAVYRLFGFGLWQTRVPPLLFAAGAIAALWALGLRLLGDRRAATLAAAIFALDPKLLQAARSGRMDPQCLLFALLGALLAARALDELDEIDEAETRRFHGHLALAGIATGLAGITHPLAVAWALGLGLVIVWRGRGRRKLTGPLVFAAAAGLPAALWIAWAFAAAGPATFAAQFLDHGTGHLAGGSILGRAVAELGNYARQYELAPLLLAAYAISLPWFFLRSPVAPEAKRTVAALFSATFLFNLLFMTKGLGFYYLYPGTMLALCAGSLAATLLPQPFSLRTAAGLTSAGLLLLLALSLLAGGLAGRWLSLAFQWRQRDYAPVEAAVREAVPAGSVVWGPAEVWYAVEQAGASLRLLGHPDPAQHDFVVLRKDSPVRLGKRAVVVREIGEPLPPVLGLRRASADYTFRIWTWMDRAPAGHGP